MLLFFYTCASFLVTGSSLSCLQVLMLETLELSPWESGLAKIPMKNASRQYGSPKPPVSRNLLGDAFDFQRRWPCKEITQYRDGLHDGWFLVYEWSLGKGCWILRKWCKDTQPILIILKLTVSQPCSLPDFGLFFAGLINIFAVKWQRKCK